MGNHEAPVLRSQFALPVPSGRYINTAPGGVSAATITNNQLRGYPWTVSQRVRIDRIGAEVTIVGDAGSVIRIGLYEDNDGLPGDLITEFGTVPGDSVGAHEITVDETLEPGIYWLAAAVQNVSVTSPTLRVTNTSSAIPGVSGTSFGSGNGFVGVVQSSVSGALPSPFVPADSTSAMVRIIPRTV